MNALPTFPVSECSANFFDMHSYLHTIKLDA